MQRPIGGGGGRDRNGGGSGKDSSSDRSDRDGSGDKMALMVKMVAMTVNVAATLRTAVMAEAT
jgi:hypothetical protein